jgi:hypothetical protein
MAAPSEALRPDFLPLAVNLAVNRGVGLCSLAQEVQLLRSKSGCQQRESNPHELALNGF